MEKNNASFTKGTQGYTLVELVTVMAIIGILGTMLVSMLNIGVQFYRTENSTMDNQNNARLAMAYITVKIRQHDMANDVATGNGISVSPLASDSSLNVLHINDMNSPEKHFWIYYDSNTHTLREQTGNSVFDSVLENGTEIADLSYFNIAQSGANLHFEVKSIDGSVDLAQDITLRSL